MFFLFGLSSERKIFSLPFQGIKKMWRNYGSFSFRGKKDLTFCFISSFFSCLLLIVMNFDNLPQKTPVSDGGLA